MTYRVELSRQAERYLRRLRPSDQARLALRIDEIATDPFGPHTKPLSNLAGRRAARVGDYRMVFTVDDAAGAVYVSDLGPRGDVYRHLPN